MIKYVIKIIYCTSIVFQNIYLHIFQLKFIESYFSQYLSSLWHCHISMCCCVCFWCGLRSAHTSYVVRFLIAYLVRGCGGSVFVVRQATFCSFSINTSFYSCLHRSERSSRIRWRGHGTVYTLMHFFWFCRVSESVMPVHHCVSMFLAMWNGVEKVVTIANVLTFS